MIPWTWKLRAYWLILTQRFRRHEPIREAKTARLD